MLVIRKEVPRVPLSHMVNYALHLQKTSTAAQKLGVLVRQTKKMPKHLRPTPVRGAFRMGEVLIPQNNHEEALFVLLHGIGHMAQWSVFPEEHERSYFFNSKSNAWGEKELKEIWDHEWGALPFVLGFLGENELKDLEYWYVKYFIADQEYLADILRDNEYGLQKFTNLLEKVRGQIVSEKLESKAMPKLVLNIQKESYICVL